jgi:hypothetical protein
MIQIEFTENQTVELRGHQSVRTTFKLSERCINALSVLASQMGIKQKSLFDHLVDDVQVLKTIAKEFDDFPVNEQRVAKTYVISRRTLENLEQVSSRYNTPRDALVEFSIERILPLLEREKARHARRTEIAQQLAVQLQKSAQLLQEAERDLGEDDPLVQEIYGILNSSDAAFRRINAYLEKGKKVCDF